MAALHLARPGGAGGPGGARPSATRRRAGRKESSEESRWNNTEPHWDRTGNTELGIGRRGTSMAPSKWIKSPHDNHHLQRAATRLGSAPETVAPSLDSNLIAHHTRTRAVAALSPHGAGGFSDHGVHEEHAGAPAAMHTPEWAAAAEIEVAAPTAGEAPCKGSARPT